jgi:hypothetical protein
MRAQTYLLHLPQAAYQGEMAVLEKAVLIRDGFSWGAFVFTFLWFFWNRLWLVGFGVLVLMFASGAIMDALELPAPLMIVMQGLLSLLIGFEANHLKSWTLNRRGKPLMDAVLATSVDEAETKSFARWLEPHHKTASPSSPSPSPSPSAASVKTVPAMPAVIGLFPEAEPSR